MNSHQQAFSFGMLKKSVNTERTNAIIWQKHTVYGTKIADQGLPLVLLDYVVQGALLCPAFD